MKIQKVGDIQNNEKFKKFQSRKVYENKVKLCFSYIFNINATILFAGSLKGAIKIFGFNSVQKFIQTLQYHTNDVGCLIYMKKSNQFISGSNDTKIFVWSLDQDNQWKPYQTLAGHTEWISCMIINDDENLLISGSGDKTIKFWYRVNLNWSCSQTINTFIKVRCLSLNPSSTMLTICGTEIDSIKLFEFQSNEQWTIKQNIITQEGGYRLCFIDDNQFVFQTLAVGCLEIYKYDEEKKQFFKEKQIQVQHCLGCYWLFQSQFIKQKNILIVKHGYDVNFFEINQYEDYTLQQTIKFKSRYLYGTLTDDGQFLVTWDNYSNLIQVRKFLC